MNREARRLAFSRSRPDERVEWVLAGDWQGRVWHREVDRTRDCCAVALVDERPVAIEVFVRDDAGRLQVDSCNQCVLTRVVPLYGLRVELRRRAPEDASAV